MALAVCLALGLSGCSLQDSALLVRSSLMPDAPLAEMPYIDPNIDTPFEPAASIFYYDRLDSDEARTVYRAALAHFAGDDSGSIYLKGSYTAAQVAAALRAVRYDHPQLLCAPWGQKCSYYTTSDGEVVGIELVYSETPAQRQEYRSALYLAINDLLKQAAAYTDPFERELFLYDAVLTAVDYDRQAALAGLSPAAQELTALPLSDRLAHTAYGALVAGRAVCDGYAGAFQVLCSYAGIPSAMVSGYSATGDELTDSFTENHAWALVELESGSYYCDLTWDDNGDCWLTEEGELVTAPEDTDGMTAVKPEVLHRYMNLTYEEFSHNHAPAGAIDYPTAADGSDNYYKKTGLYCDTPAQLTALAKKLCEEQEQPDILFFEARLGFDAERGDILSAALSNVGDYSYLLAQTVPNETDSVFFCLYS